MKWKTIRIHTGNVYVQRVCGTKRRRDKEIERERESSCLLAIQKRHTLVEIGDNCKQFHLIRFVNVEKVEWLEVVFSIRFVLIIFEK